jgi:hypothetical protein
MHTYVDLYFSPNGENPLAIADRLRRQAGVSLIVGPHDIAFEWQTVEEFRTKLSAIHDALQGSDASYRVESVEESPEFIEPTTWPPTIVRSQPSHPGYNPA